VLGNDQALKMFLIEKGIVVYNNRVNNKRNSIIRGKLKKRINLM
jgi:hypothetical protein